MPFKIQPELNLQGSQGQIAKDKLPDGIAGNLSTIDMMKKVARLRSGDPLIHKLAVNILDYYSTQSNNYVDEALAVGDYVKNKIPYVRDPDQIEYLQDPLRIIWLMQNGGARGDCDDMALFIATLLLSIGHKPLFCAVRYESNIGNYNHIYVVDYDKNKGGPLTRVALDAIVKNHPIGYEVQSQSGDEFEIP